MVQFLAAGYYTWPFWFGFASGLISATQFGVYLAIGHIVSLLAEVPTGAIADKFGRKQSAMIGLLCAAMLPLIIYVGASFPAYVVGAIVAGIGGAFVSGSLDSHLYELPSMDKELFRRVMIFDTFFWQMGLIISSAVGGFLYVLSPVIPFLGESVSFILAVILVARMSDTMTEKTNDEEAAQLHYWTDLSDGFIHLFRVRILWPLITFGSMVSVLMWMGIEYTNEAAMIHYGIPPEKRGLLIAVSKLLMLVSLNAAILSRIKTDRAKLQYLLMLTVTIYLLFAVGQKAWFLIGFLMFNFVSATSANFIRPIIHDHVQNRWRATALSSYSFVGSALQAIAALGVGVLLQANGVVFVQRVLLLCFLVIGLPAFLRYRPKTST